MDMQTLLEIGMMHQASDVHLSPAHPTFYRINGQLASFHPQKWSAEEVYQLIISTMKEKDRQIFDSCYECDYAFEFGNRRFRAHAFFQHYGASVTFRFISENHFDMQQLGLPPAFQQCSSYRNGLVLVTGATGSGKSTTLSAMIEHINQTQHKHIITIEDPIEYLHQSKMSLIQQREVKRHTLDFESALYSALRQDPDVIVLGEIRDKKTIALALHAAETGHLVFATLHAPSAIQSIDRIIQYFSNAEQQLARTVLSSTLRVVLSQELIQKKAGGMRGIYELMIVTPAVSNLLRENKLVQIYSVMQTQQTSGMQTREQHMALLQKQGEI